MNDYDLIRIAKNDYYEMYVNQPKNFLVISFLGIWNNTVPIEDYLKDLDQAVEKLSPNFNLFADLTLYKGNSPEHSQTHIDALKSLAKSGLNKTAVILYGNPMLKIAVEYIFNQAGIPVGYFNNRLSAEYWLST